MGTVLELHGFFVFFKSWFRYFVYLQMTGYVQARKPPPPIFQNTAVCKQTLSTFSLKDTLFL